ncbi:stomatin family protein [Hyaloraphidium curvatum]|nr:stomatin family protein [Hyaloraphidium curvatum]
MTEMEGNRHDEVSTQDPLIPEQGKAKNEPYPPTDMTVNFTTAQPSFAHEIAVVSGKSNFYERFYTGLGDIFGTLGAIPGCVCFPNAYKVVPQGTVGLVTRFGKFYKSVDPGLHYVTPIVENLTLVDIKIQTEEIPRQTVTTKDNVSIQIDSVLFWHVVDPFTAAFLVGDLKLALVERTQTTLRSVLGTKVLQDAIENRDQIAHEISELIEGPASAWGVRVESMLIKDLVFSQELQETLSSAAKQKRIGESKVIQARAEVDAAKLMRQAADVLSTPAAMQIRYLDTLSAMARSGNSKVIFVPGSSELAAQSTTSSSHVNPLQQSITGELTNE